MKYLLFFILGVGLACAQASSPPAPPPAAAKSDASAITKTQLENRLIELQRGRDQAMANMNAFLGAIQEVQHWLEEMKAASEPKPKPDPKPETQQ